MRPAGTAGRVLRAARAAALAVSRLRAASIGVACLCICLWVVGASSGPALASCSGPSGPCSAGLGLGEFEYATDLVPFSPVTTDSQSDVSVGVQRHWYFQIYNGGPGDVGSASIEATSLRTFSTPTPPPPFSANAAPLAAGDTLRTSGESAYATDSAAPGYASSRSFDTIVIPPGGATETMTVKFTVDSADWSGVGNGMAMTFDSNDPHGASWAYTNISSAPTDPNLSADATQPPVMSNHFGLSVHPVVGTTYTLIFTGTIANPTSQPFAYKPSLAFLASHSGPVGQVFGSSYSVYDPLLEGTITYKFDDQYQLGPSNNYAFGVNYQSGTAPVTCPTGTKANFRWHYSANGSSGSWSGTKAVVCPGSLTMGPQAMEGDLKVSPGATLKAGYDFTVPGNTASLGLVVGQPQVVFAVRCASGAPPSQGTLKVSMSDQGYSVTNAQWYPSGDQSSSATYEGSVVVPDLCNGGQLRLDQGGTFTANVS